MTKYLVYWKHGRVASTVPTKITKELLQLWRADGIVAYVAID